MTICICLQWYNHLVVDGEKNHFLCFDRLNEVTTVKVIIQRLYIFSIQSNTIYRMKLVLGCTIVMYFQTTMDHGKKMVNSMFGYFY